MGSTLTKIMLKIIKMSDKLVFQFTIVWRLVWKISTNQAELKNAKKATFLSYLRWTYQNSHE